MKKLLLIASFALPLFSSHAWASSLTCTAPGLSYWSQHSDGGPAINPEAMLILRHEILLDQDRYEPVKPGKATFALTGKSKRLARDRKDSDYVTRTFSQQAQVTRLNDNGEEYVAFEGTVICQSETYVGMPRP